MIAPVLLAAALMGTPAPYVPNRYSVRTWLHDGVYEFHPHSKWIKVDWVETAEGPFAARQAEWDRELSQPDFNVDPMYWRRARSAARELRADSRNPRKLFEATGCYLVAAQLNPNFGASDEGQQIREMIDEYWNYVDRPPWSYTFVRIGYVFNASGAVFEEQFGDLAFKLLARKPDDKDVVLAMSKEYRQRDDAKFVATVTKETKELGRKGLWVRWDRTSLASMDYLKWRRHKDRKDLRRAISILATVIGTTPREVDTRRLEERLAKWKATAAEL